GIALTMLGGRYVLPLHAACVERAGKGLLLCGNSGSGKSSLAYACARAGWNFLSDDASYLVSNSGSRLVVGNPQRLRMRPSAKQLFPEIRAFDLTPHATTEPSIEIPTSQLSLRTAHCTTVEHVVFLNRNHDGPAALLPFPKPMAMAWARQSWEATEDEGEEAPGLDRLLNAKLHEMRYSDLHDAIRLLEQMAGHE
ncbi:MAG: aldolase, partial [Acidobacteriaceae bacterium]